MSDLLLEALFGMAMFFVGWFSRGYRNGSLDERQARKRVPRTSARNDNAKVQP